MISFGFGSLSTLCSVVKVNLRKLVLKVTVRRIILYRNEYFIFCIFSIYIIISYILCIYVEIFAHQIFAKFTGIVYSFRKTLNSKVEYLFRKLANSKVGQLYFKSRIV